MKYYFPFVTYRTEATVSQGILQLFDAVLQGKTITVHTNQYLAKKEAESMLFDDDDDGVLCLEVNGQGDIRVYTLRNPYFTEYVRKELTKHLNIIA